LTSTNFPGRGQTILTWKSFLISDLTIGAAEEEIHKHETMIKAVITSKFMLNLGILIPDEDLGR
jgi:hypothetical protein